MQLTGEKKRVAGFLKDSPLFKKLKKIGLSFDRISKVDLAIFAHQFSAMIGAGLPLIKCLLVLSKDTENKKLKKVIEKVVYDIERGLSLSGALEKHPQVFSNFFVNMIRSGETAGILPTVLKRLADHLEKEEDLNQKVVSAFAYPAVVGLVAVVVISFLLIYIVPVFKNIYKTLKINLPLPTLLLINLSNSMVKYAWLYILLIIGIFYGFRRLKKNKKMVFLLDYFSFFMPVFGRLNRKIATARFTRTLASMLSSGVPLNRSLDASNDVINNSVASAVIRALKNSIGQGRGLNEVLQKQKIFLPMAVQMIATGEESGTLDMMLNKVADFLDEDILLALKSVGCYHLDFGIESGSQKVLNLMKKGKKIEKIAEKVYLSRKNGFKLSASFLFGTPGETLSDMEETIRFAASLPLDSASFGIMIPFPGTELRKEVMEKKYLVHSNYEYYNPGVENFKPPIETPEWTAADLLNMMRKANRAFFFRPKQILKLLPTMVLNPVNLKRYMSSLFRVLRG